MSVIESFKNQEMAKVKFGENDSRYFMLKDLQVIEPPKPKRTEPLETFRVGDIVIDPKDPNKWLSIDSIKGDTAVVRYGNGNYNIYAANLEDLVSLKTWELGLALVKMPNRPVCQIREFQILQRKERAGYHC